jgi:hypothetical protein
MSSIYDWSTTAASNANSDTGINWNEGQAPSTVNNSARAMMGRFAEFVKDQGGTLVAGGTGNALTLTANSAFVSYASGLIVAFKAAADNTGAATLSVNSIGAKSIRKFTSTGETALDAGNIKQNNIYAVRYDAAANGGVGAWILNNPSGPSAPAFRAHRNGVNQAITGGVLGKALLTSEMFDIGGYYNAALAQWTPPAGTVHLYGTVSFLATGIAVGDIISAAIAKNGLSLAAFTTATANINAATSNIAVTDRANGTDYYELFVGAGTGGTKTVNGADSTYFCGHLV